MKISQTNWQRYVRRLSRVNKKASELMSQWIATHGTEDANAMIQYAYAIATKYGEAAATLACEMYDAIALASGKSIAPAEPARTATIQETAIAVNGAKLQGEAVIPMAVERLVKLAGQDTTLQNARRDGAEWAWIPSGDTCSFCIMLASNGWQRASKRVKAGTHADHIHANCDCAFAIRFNGAPEYASYDPDEYYDKYNNASDSYDWKDKLNAMRRENYASKKDLINAQKREAYAKRKATTLHNKTVTESELKSVSRNWYDGLSLREQGLAVSFDTYNFTRDANRLNDTKELAQAISKYNLPGNITTYRGVSQEEFTDMIFNYGSKGLKTGEIKGTSIDLGRAEAFASTRGGYVFEYHINPGNNGAYFDGGVPGSNEQQFVLNKDVKYEVESVDQKNKRIILNVG